MSSKFPDHRGQATWGRRLVPLEEFHRRAASHGVSLGEEDRRTAIREHLVSRPTIVPVEGPYRKVAVLGGTYSNYFALEALLDDARRRGAEAVYGLGDLGGFGPNPERILPLVQQGAVRCLQGNYEQSLAAGEEDCNCGYTDPRDNHFAALSFEYTAAGCSAEFKAWMGGLPEQRRIRVGRRELVLVHGSPRQVNEFLFHSTSSIPFLERLLDGCGADGFLCTHTGLHWHRRLPSGRDVVNVGVIGRPANDGHTHVWYCVLDDRGDGLGVEFVPLRYDHERLAAAMREQGLPPEFVETILTGWWTTCLEILPARERSESRY